jgi:hypothetical protein
VAYLAANAAWLVGFAVADRTALGDLDAALAAGRTVDAGLAGRVLAQEIAGRLPAALLTLAAAVLFLAVLHRITGLQYDRFDGLRPLPPPHPPHIPAQVVRRLPAARSTPVGPEGATIGP